MRFDDWLAEARERYNRDLVIFIIGNKADLGNDVTSEDGEAVAYRIGAKYYETGKGMHNLGEIFREIVRELISDRKNSRALPGIFTPTVVLTNNEMINKENACC